MSKKKEYGKDSPEYKLAAKIRRLAGKSIDIYIHGLDWSGKKQLCHINGTEKLNSLFNFPPKPEKTLSEDPSVSNIITWKYYREDCKEINKAIQDASFSTKLILEHITGQKKRYYVNSQLKDIAWIGFDVDNHIKDPSVVTPWFIFLTNSFPNIWSDSGSSGNSLHPIIKTNMLPLKQFYNTLNPTKLTYPEVANKVLLAIAHIIKIYGHNILTPTHSMKPNKSGKLVPKYDVALCGVKGTYSSWDYNIGSDGSVFRNTVLGFGSMFKFPNIKTEDDYSKFKNAPVYSILDIINFSLYLSNSLFLSNTLTSPQKRLINKAVALLEPVLDSNGQSLPLIPSNKSLGKKKERKDNSIGSLFLGFDASDDDISSYEPLERCRKSVQKLCRILGRKPEYEEWNKYYEMNGWNTAAETEERRSRFERVVEYVWDGFDYDLAGNGKYHKPGDNIVEARAMISEEELKEWNKKYCKKINYIDIDMMIGYTRSALNDTEKRDEGAWSNKYQWKFTIPLHGLKKFWDKRKDEGQIQRSYHNVKATSLMNLMLEKQWLIKIADHYAGDDESNGVARKYVMTDKHPYYKEFVDIYGKEDVELIIAENSAESLSLNTSLKI